jgi:tetratricopeptide (TPR) repeat protein
MDAFNDMAVPFQLTTQQFNDKIFDITAADSVYLANLIDMSESGKFVGSYVATIRQTFPNVYVVKKPLSGELPTNFIVIAAKQPVNLDGLNTDELLAGTSIEVFDENNLTSLEAKGGGSILDDDHAPVENLMVPTVRCASEVEMTEKFFAEAEKLNSAGKWQKALSKCRQATEACPAWSGKAYYLMGQILAEHGRFAEAVDTLYSVLSQTDANKDRVSAASLHYNIGVILQKIGNAREASRHLVSADKLLRAELAGNDGHAEIFWYLGKVQEAIGNMEQASHYYQEAVQKDPNEVIYHLSAVEALARQRQYDLALRQAKESIDYMLSKGRKGDAEQLKELMRRLQIENNK